MAAESSSEAHLDLSKRIYSRLKSSVFDTRLESFLPDGEIDGLVSMEAIQKRLLLDKIGAAALAGLGASAVALDAEENELVNWIHQKANKVFAIVVLVELQIVFSETLKSMKYFRAHGFNNSSLPIKNPVPSSYEQWNCPEKFDSQIWHQARLSHFYRTQWWFLAPVFSTGYRYNLEPDHTLPFVKKDQLTREGAFSFVHKITIHDAHANPSYSKVN